MKIVRFFLNIFLFIIGIYFISEYEKNNFKVTSYKISSNKIKNKKRLVFLSDLHDKEFSFENISLIKKIEELKPDAILIGGDFVCTKKNVDITKTIEFCKKLAKKYKLYYANGNHELRMKNKKYANIYNIFSKKLFQIGAIHLSNSKVKLDEINIYGLDIDDIFYKKINIPKMKDEYIEKKLGHPNKEEYNILLAHSPNFFDNYAKWGSDLALAGHFHGGTIRIGENIGLMTPQIQFFNQNVVGIKSKGNSKMIISAGLGTHTINIRLNNRPEIVCIDLDSR